MTTLHCHCCGKRLKAYAVAIRTAAGLQGYGPKCGRAMALQACTLAAWTAGINREDLEGLRQLVKAKGWDGRRIGGRARRSTRRAVKAQPVASAQLTLDLEIM